MINYASNSHLIAGMKKFSNKTVLITGGTDGIGLAAARAFAAQGAQVVIAARKQERGQQLEAELQGQGHAIYFIQADVADPEAIQRMLAFTLDKFGRLDIAVNNAAADIRMALSAELSESEFDASMAVNVKGLWLCMKHQILAMQHSGGGAIVNVASINGLKGTSMAAAYSAGKHAVIGLTKSAAKEYISANIRINAVCPGLTDTQFQHRPLQTLSAEDFKKYDAARTAAMPIGRMARPEEIAAGILWLSSDEASYVVGHALVIDGGVSA